MSDYEFFPNPYNYDQNSLTVQDVENLLKGLTVNGNQIEESSVDYNHLVPDSIGEIHIRELSVNNAAIQNLAVTSAKIDNGQIKDFHFDRATGDKIQIIDGDIVNVNASKLNAGTVDTAKVTIQGDNGHLRMVGNRIQVFDDQATPVERVSIGDVNADGTVYGLRVRGADGVTVLYDESGVYNEGITDGAITNPKIGDDAVDGRNIAANSVTADHMVTDTITAQSGVIADAAITTAKIADASITNAKIESLVADKIIGGDFSGETFTGGTFSGSAFIADSTNGKVELDDRGYYHELNSGNGNNTLINFRYDPLVFAHSTDGGLTNDNEIKFDLEGKRAIFSSTDIQLSFSKIYSNNDIVIEPYYHLDIHTTYNGSSGDPILLVTSSGNAERLRVEHNGALSTANSTFRLGANSTGGGGGTYFHGNYSNLGIGGSASSSYKLRVHGDIYANNFIRGDIQHKSSYMEFHPYNSTYDDGTYGRVFYSGNDRYLSWSVDNGTGIEHVASAFTTSSLEEGKEQINEWNDSVLDLFRDRTQMKLYTWVNKGDEKKNINHGFVIGEGYETPDILVGKSQKGISGYEHSSFNTKAIQEIVSEMDLLKQRVTELENAA